MPASAMLPIAGGGDVGVREVGRARRAPTAARSRGRGRCARAATTIGSPRNMSSSASAAGREDQHGLPDLRRPSSASEPPSWLQPAPAAKTPIDHGDRGGQDAEGEPDAEAPEPAAAGTRQRRRRRRGRSARTPTTQVARAEGDEQDHALTQREQRRGMGRELGRSGARGEQGRERPQRGAR